MFEIKSKLAIIGILLARYYSNSYPKLITTHYPKSEQSKNNQKQRKQNRVQFKIVSKAPIKNK